MEPSLAGPEPQAVPPPIEGVTGLPPPVERKVLLAEVAAILCLAVVPHLVYSLIYYFGPGAAPSSFGVDMLTLAVGSLQISVPILYILWRSGEPLASFGLLRPRWLLDSGAGVLVFLLTWVVNDLGWRAGYSVFGNAILDSTPTTEGLFSVPRSAGDFLVFYVAMTANAFAEELAMRGYLMTRLRQLGVAPFLTVLISAGLFGAYHIYQGVWASVLVTLFGFVFACAFLWLRRLWPVALAHLLLDLLAFSGGSG